MCLRASVYLLACLEFHDLQASVISAWLLNKQLSVPDGGTPTVQRLAFIYDDASDRYWRPKLERRGCSQDGIHMPAADAAELDKWWARRIPVVRRPQISLLYDRMAGTTGMCAGRYWISSRQIMLRVVIGTRQRSLTDNSYPSLHG